MSVEGTLVIIQTAHTFAEAAATYRDALIEQDFNEHLAAQTALQMMQTLFQKGVFS